MQAGTKGPGEPRRLRPRASPVAPAVAMQPSQVLPIRPPKPSPSAAQHSTPAWPRVGNGAVEVARRPDRVEVLLQEGGFVEHELHGFTIRDASEPTTGGAWCRCRIA